MDNSLNIKSAHICRTCMEEIINTAFFHLDFTQIDSEPTIGQKLSHCIPELDLDIVPNTLICGKCADTINSLYVFKKECLRLETQIREYIQQVQHTGSVTDLAAVVQFHQLHSKNINAELKTEAFEKTENYNYTELYSRNLITEFKMETFDKNENSPTYFCDNYHLDKTEGNTEIANNEYLTSLEMVDRECVLFNTAEDLFNSVKPETEENLYTHADSNIVNNCLPQVVENFQNLNKTDIYYQCFICGHKAESKLKLIRHMKSHTAKKASQKKMSFKSCKSLLCWYRCDLCNYSTKHKCLVSFHSRAHLTKKYYQRILKSRPILVKHSTNTITFGKKDSKDNKINCGSPSSNKHNLKYWRKSLSKYSESKQDSNQCNVSKLAIHSTIIVKPFKCSVCERSFTRKDHLKMHLLIHTGEKPCKCSVCEYSCIQKSDLKSHMRTHTNEKLFKCSICEYSSNHRTSLKRHMLTHTDEKPFNCSVCEYSCKHKSSLKVHMLTHTGEKLFKCSLCEYSCNYKKVIKIHILTHTGEKPFTCSNCQFSCNSKNSLKRHMLNHTGEKPFRCLVCEYSSNRKTSLNCHMLTHTGEKPFKCLVCEYSSNHISDVKRHMLTHTGEKPFKCSVCEYSCRQKSHLKGHMLTHTGEKPFTCSVCEYSSNHKGHLKTHMLIHTGEKPFRCSVCEYSCRDTKSLKRHMLTHNR